MLQLNITTQPIRLDYTLQKAQLNLQTSPANLQMETTPPTLEIRQPRGELTIDSTPCYYSLGIKNNTDFARDNAELGRQTLQETIARIVDKGNQFAQIQNKTNMIAELAVRRPEKRELVLAPLAAPDIRYQANPAEINFIPGKLTLTPQPGGVQGDYQPGSVDIRVSQYPSIEITIVDVKV